ARVNPAPAEGAEEANDAAEADAPVPAPVLADPGGDGGGEQADQVSSRVTDGGGGASGVSANIDGGGPEGAFARSERSQRQREPKDDPEGILRLNTEPHQTRAQRHAATRDQGAPATNAHASRCPIGQRSAQRHSERQRHLR